MHYNSCAEQFQGSSKLPCAAAQGHCRFCRQLGALSASPGFFPSGRAHLQEELRCSAASTAHSHSAGLRAAQADPVPPCSKTARFPATSSLVVFTYPVPLSLYLPYFYPAAFRQNLPLSRFIGGK